MVLRGTRSPGREQSSGRLRRRALMGWTAVVVAAPAVFASTVWATSITPPELESPPPPPAEVAASLDCGGGMAIIYHSDFYVTKDDDSAAKNPDEALDRLLSEVYPGAIRERAFTRVPDHMAGLDIPGHEHDVAARYEALSLRDRQAAVLTVAEKDEQYYVEDVAICEYLAKRWAR